MGVFCCCRNTTERMEKKEESVLSPSSKGQKQTAQVGSSSESFSQPPAPAPWSLFLVLLWLLFSVLLFSLATTTAAVWLWLLLAAAEEEEEKVSPGTGAFVVARATRCRKGAAFDAVFRIKSEIERHKFSFFVVFLLWQFFVLLLLLVSGSGVLPFATQGSRSFVTSKAFPAREAMAGIAPSQIEALLPQAAAVIVLLLVLLVGVTTSLSVTESKR